MTTIDPAPGLADQLAGANDLIEVLRAQCKTQLDAVPGIVASARADALAENAEEIVKLKAENERLREENARLSGLAGRPYYFAPDIDEECAADEVRLVMEDVPVGEIQEIEVHCRTGFVYAVWVNENTLLEFKTEEQARAALSTTDAREGK